MPSRTRKTEILVANMIKIKAKLKLVSVSCLSSLFCKCTASENQMSDSEKLHSASDTGSWCLEIFF